MKQTTARILAVFMFLIGLAINIAGYLLLPPELSLPVFGNTPLPSMVPLIAAQALILLVAGRMALAMEPPVRSQMAVVLVVLVLADAALVALGAGWI